MEHRSVCLTKHNFMRRHRAWRRSLSGQLHVPAALLPGYKPPLYWIRRCGSLTVSVEGARFNFTVYLTTL
jgi:hypothetical protein